MTKEQWSSILRRLDKGPNKRNEVVISGMSLTEAKLRKATQRYGYVTVLEAERRKRGKLEVL